MPNAKYTGEINLNNLKKFYGYWDEAHQWLKDFINEREDEIRTGVEIGVAFGSNMQLLLDETKLEKLWGIDCYKKEFWDLNGIVDVEKEFGGFDGLHAHVVELIKPYEPRGKIIRMTSQNASKKFRNESLDFVFIDSNHFDLENDLQYWERKVRDGGYIMGHDWNHPSFGNITSHLMERYDEDSLVGIDGPVHVWYVKKGAFM